MSVTLHVITIKCQTRKVTKFASNNSTFWAKISLKMSENRLKRLYGVRGLQCTNSLSICEQSISTTLKVKLCQRMSSPSGSLTV